MRRRDFIRLVSGVAAPVAISTSLFAQATPKLLVWMGAFPIPPMPQRKFFGFLAAFQDGMREQGQIEGRDFTIAVRTGQGFADLPRLVDEIVELKPDVIVAAATLEAVAAKKGTSTIPIVCPALADAVHLGLIESEARPGGNITGVEPYIGGLPAKQIELALEIVTGATKIGLLTNNRDPKGPPQVRDLEAAAKTLGLTLVSANADLPEEIGPALDRLVSEKVDVAIVLQTNVLLLNGSVIADVAAKNRLPTVFGYREHIQMGGLISYGVDLRWCYRRGAYFAVKILKGAKPGELPIEFPTSFWLAINLRTAKAIGANVSPSLLARADEVIE
jgi:putative tryptophan/tyrosine transport system substrate-binding protein